MHMWYESDDVLRQAAAANAAATWSSCATPDTVVAGFEREGDARRFLEAMRQRLAAFALLFRSLIPLKRAMPRLSFSANRCGAARHRFRNFGVAESSGFWQGRPA